MVGYRRFRYEYLRPGAKGDVGSCVLQQLRLAFEFIKRQHVVTILKANVFACGTLEASQLLAASGPWLRC